MNNKRKKKLVQPGLQLRLTAAFLGTSVLAMMLQFLFLGGRLMSALGQLDDGGGSLADEVPGLMLGVCALSLLVFVPILFFLGITLTHRFAGPTYRFESYLRSVAAGEVQGPCSIRENDEMKSLCEAINLATKPLWVTPAGEDGKAKEPGAAA